MRPIPSAGRPAQAPERAPDEAIWLLITPEVAMSLVGQLLLALRHPGNRGPTAAIARDVARQLAAQFRRIDPPSVAPEFKEVIYAEWERELGDLNDGR